MLIDRRNIVDSREIADKLGVKIGTVRKWRHRYESFPAPLKVLSVGPVWDWVEVNDWWINR